MIRSFLSRRQILAGGLLAVPALVEFKAKGWAKNTTDTSAPAPEIRPGLDVFFERAETAGAFVALRDGRLVANDEKRIGEGLLPASTFKVPHSIIALETGVVSDPDKDIFKWDGIPRGFPDWNKDHTLRSAIAASAVPVYQQIARRIGPERMQRYMDLIDYGNHSIGGGMDRFWLTGDLRVSPRQQVDFLDRLQRRALAVSERSQELALDILPVTKAGNAILRAKSGLVGVDDKAGIENATAGWLVGLAEHRNHQTAFALYLEIREPRHIADRAKLAIQCLTEIDAV